MYQNFYRDHGDDKETHLLFPVAASIQRCSSALKDTQSCDSDVLRAVFRNDDDDDDGGGGGGSSSSSSSNGN